MVFRILLCVASVTKTFKLSIVQHLLWGNFCFPSYILEQSLNSKSTIFITLGFRKEFVTSTLLIRNARQTQKLQIALSNMLSSDVCVCTQI
jgi:hypothetical protein